MPGSAYPAMIDTLRDFLGRETVPDSTSTDRTDGYAELADGL